MTVIILPVVMSCGCASQPNGYSFKIEVFDSIPADIDTYALLKENEFTVGSGPYPAGYEIYYDALKASGLDMLISTYSMSKKGMKALASRILMDTSSNVSGLKSDLSCGKFEAHANVITASDLYSISFPSFVERIIEEIDMGDNSKLEIPLSNEAGIPHYKFCDRTTKEKFKEQLKAAVRAILIDAMCPNLLKLYIREEIIRRNVSVSTTRGSPVPFLPKTVELAERRVFSFSDAGNRDFTRVSIYLTWGYFNSEPIDKDGVYREIFTLVFNTFKSCPQTPLTITGFAGYDKREGSVLLKNVVFTHPLNDENTLGQNVNKRN